MLAPTPPMGWNSWNTFGAQIDEKLIHETADAFIREGLQDAGYQYVCLDDGWEAPERDAPVMPHRLKLLALFGNEARPIVGKPGDRLHLGLHLLGQDMPIGGLQVDDHRLVGPPGVAAAVDAVAQGLV